MALVSFARRLTELANAEPDRLAVTCGPDRLSRSELDAAGNRAARHLQRLGVERGDMVTVAVPNSVEWFVAFVACWKVGATPQPVSARMPARELEAIVELADPKVIVGIDAGTFPDRACLPVGALDDPSLDSAPLPDTTSPSWKAPTSGGSTGRPKLIVSGDESVMDTDAPSLIGAQMDGCVVMPGPLYHNGPLIWSTQGLLFGNHVVVLPRFDAEGTLAAIAAYKGDIVYLVPTMMKRIWRLPEEVRLSYDLSSLRLVWHLAEPCPMWLKDAWIEWLGAERIIELYGGTEGQSATVITGPEWVAHRGSVGKPAFGSIMICDADGNPLPPGAMGEVWLRADHRETPTYRYIGAQARRREDGWESLGDMGWLDDDGYLYLGDRQQDMILVGGANVYPAEVEAALQEHPAIRSCVVIGLPDDDKGNRIHAIIEGSPSDVSEAELLTFLAERLARYKLPSTFEYVDSALRDDAGKVRRGALRAERLESTEVSATQPTQAGGFVARLPGGAG